MTMIQAMITARTSSACCQIEIEDIAQAGTATPLVDLAAESPGTDADGWIDCRGHSQIHASATATGAAATITAQIKTSRTSPPVALVLADGALASGATEVLLDAALRCGFIRFLAAGTAAPGNTIDLFIQLK